jgi:hypothetical protein
MSASGSEKSERLAAVAAVALVRSKRELIDFHAYAARLDEVREQDTLS